MGPLLSGRPSRVLKGIRARGRPGPRAAWLPSTSQGRPRGPGRHRCPARARRAPSAQGGIAAAREAPTRATTAREGTAETQERQQGQGRKSQGTERKSRGEARRKDSKEMECQTRKQGRGQRGRRQPGTGELTFETQGQQAEASKEPGAKTKEASEQAEHKTALREGPRQQDRKPETNQEKS